MAYRQFWEAAIRTQLQGWDILKSLTDWVEIAYSDGFLLSLALSWGKALDSGLLDDWRIGGVPNQFQFYATFVKPILARSDTQRAIVIISDAFRYEAARELLDTLNTRYRFDASLTTQLWSASFIHGIGHGIFAAAHFVVVYVKRRSARR